MVGQTICIPVIPAPLRTPCSVLLPPIISNLPPASEIPTGAVVVRQRAMSTRAYTIVAEGLPDPGANGNFDAYVGILSLFRADTGFIPAFFVKDILIWETTFS